MRIGIGGGAFGIRGGISNRGIGVGVGPLSVGGSFRRRRSSSSNGIGLFESLVLAVVAVLIVAWPYMLGTWMAVAIGGAANPSSGRSALGWTFESIYVVAVVSLVIAWQRDTAQRRADEAARAEAERLVLQKAYVTLVESGVVFPDPSSSGAVYYLHGDCPTRHRTEGTAERCRAAAMKKEVWE